MHGMYVKRRLTLSLKKPLSVQGDCSYVDFFQYFLSWSLCDTFDVCFRAQIAVELSISAIR